MNNQEEIIKLLKQAERGAKIAMILALVSVALIVVSLSYAMEGQ